MASAVSFHLGYVTVSEKVVDVPAHPLPFPKAPRYLGFEAALGAAGVDIIPRREREWPEAADVDGLPPSESYDELTEAQASVSGISVRDTLDTHACHF